MRNSKIQLYDYQKRQARFVDKSLLTSRIAGVQSGTGSGKTYVALALAYKELKMNPQQNVIITTGFNNLVYLMYRRAIEFGFDPKYTNILMGKGRTNCPTTYEQEHGGPYQIFTETHYPCSNKCKDSTESMCRPAVRKFSKYLRKQIMQTPEEGDRVHEKHGHLIITNHSMFMAMHDIFNPSLVIIDEAHTFANFYDNYMTEEVSKPVMKKINKIIDNRPILKQAFIKAINEKKPISQAIYNKISTIAQEEFYNDIRERNERNEQFNDNITEAQDKVVNGTANSHDKMVAKRHKRNHYTAMQMNMIVEKQMEEVKLLSIQPSIDNFIDIGENHYIVKHFFYNFSELFSKSNYKIVLFSATIDALTQMYFEIDDKNIYVERKQFVDFSKSTFIRFANDQDGDDWDTKLANLKLFLNTGRNINSGLILFTTIKNMTSCKKDLKDYKGYTLFTNKEKFEQFSGKKILLGSKGLFQGIDIPNLDFVVMDKYPFANVNDYSKKYEEFLKIKIPNFNPWTQRVIPLLVNDIIQGTGRLWRNKDDQGYIVILDTNSNNWVKPALRKAISIPRPGIQKFEYTGQKFVYVA